MEDRCVMCGEPVPEGTWVCANCKISKNASPCKNCIERAEACHIYCKKYMAYFKANRRAGEIRLKQIDQKDYFVKKGQSRKYNKIARNKKEE